MGVLSNSDFLSQLQSLFSSRQAKGSVFLTQKRLTYQAPGDDAVMQDDEGEREWPTLVRATDGKDNKSSKLKISTIVQPSDFSSFSSAYGTFLKSVMTTLRKKQKRKPVKSTASGAAVGAGSKKKSGATATGSGDGGKKTSAGIFVPTLPKVIGPRRGKGAHLRQRLQKRRNKEFGKLIARKTRLAKAKKLSAL
ncbi:signal recognition particle, SRP9/SRP14 subunit [Meredithblackwellia eburnea MCA 4105]